MQKYVGIYERAGGGQVEIKLVKDRLVLVHSSSPEFADTELIPDGEHKFRAKGGYYRGELVVFELDAAGNVTRLRYADRAFDRK